MLMRLEYSLLLLLCLARGSLVCFSRLSLRVWSIVKISGTFCLASLTQTTFLKYFGHFCFTSQQNCSLVFVNLSSPLDCELFRVHKHVLLSFLSLYFLPQKFSSVQFSSVQSLSRVQLLATPWIEACQASLSVPTPRVHSNSRPSIRWCHPAISSSVVAFSCPQSLSASESSPMSQLFAWGGQSIGVSALVSVLPKNTQDWSPLGWTDWISLQSKGLSRVFSNTTVQKHQFFGAQPSSQSNSHIHTWPLEKP